MAYMHPSTHPAELCFRDMEVMVNPKQAHGLVHCPLCLGHGHWNLALDCYKNVVPKHRNFRALCSQCHGYGWVGAKSADHIHVWQEVPRKKSGPRDCYHEEKCSICGVTHSYDSGD